MISLKLSRFLSEISNRKRRYLTTYPNAATRVKSMTRSGAFLVNFKVFGKVCDKRVSIEAKLKEKRNKIAKKPS